MLSHELRTPLNGIVSLAELLLGTSLTPEQRDLLDTVLESGQSLTRILSSIIDFSQLNSGLVELTLRKFNVCDVLESCIDMVNAEAASKGLVVSSILPREAMTSLVIGDSLRIRQVLVHLLSNAVKFTDSGLVELVTTASNNQGYLSLTIKVIDTGAGIPDSFKPRLFTGFTQALASCTRVHGGMGLGLAIANNLAKLMDANLTIASELGSGTTATFEILLPIALESDGSQHTSSSAHSDVLWAYTAGDRPCTSDLGTSLLEDGSSSLHVLLQEAHVRGVHKVVAVVCLEHAGLRRQVQAICEALGMRVELSNSMPSGSVFGNVLGADSQVLFCQAGAVLTALRHGWKRRPIVALCTEGHLPHMLRVHAAALATPIKVRELVLALQLAVNDCPRRTSLLVPLGQPRAAAPPTCTAGFGRSACGFCFKCQSTTAAEVDAARKRISLDNSALEKIPRKLSHPANVLSCCSEASTASSSASGETNRLPACEQKAAKDSSLGTGGSRGSTLNDLAMEEMCTTSAMSHTSAEAVTAPGAVDKAAEVAGRSEQAANRLHSYRLPPHAHPLDAAMARGRAAVLDLPGGMAPGGQQRDTVELRAERGLMEAPGKQTPAAVPRQALLSNMRKSVSLTDIVDQAKARGTTSTAMQSFLYQPNLSNAAGNCIPEEGQHGGEEWELESQHAGAYRDVSPRRALPALPVIPAPMPGGYGRPLKVLIAEDNKINQLVTRKVVGKVRPCCEIDVVSDGEAALLTILEKPEYDLVLMDLHMPRMDGLEATRRVRERHPSRPLIVALTADTVVGTRQKCLAAGMNEYVSKPFHVKDMQRILQMCG